MKKVIIPIAMILLSILSNAQNATEIVSNAYEKVKGESSYTEMTMKIIRPSWDRSISMKSWSKGMKYSMVYITEPAQERGQVFMKRDNEMWNWQPKINRIVKLPPSMMMQSWMGSDFTNDDLINEASIVNDYNHKILGSEEVNGKDCYKIEFIPKENAPVVWGKLISWISKTGYHMLKTEYYDEEDYLSKTELGSEIKMMDGEKITTKFTTIPADKEGNKTVLIMEDVNFDYDVEKEFFSKMNMKRVK